MMKPLILHDDYEQYAEFTAISSREKRVSGPGKRKPRWRDIEKTREKQQLIRELVEYNQGDVLGDLVEAFL